MLPFLIVLCIAACSALPSNPILRKLDDGPRYQYVGDSNGEIHLEDLWVSLSDYLNIARFRPEVSNVYFLYTRENPNNGQIIFRNENWLSLTNYKSLRRTIVLIHGWRNSASSEFNNVLIPALLAAEDVNVIVVDWSVGAGSLSYRQVNFNCITSAAAVADFIKWLNQASGSTLSQYHIIGHGVGGHQAGIIGRNLDRDVPYITGLDPALIGWVNHIDRFRSNDAWYTEVIHTNYGIFGYIGDLGLVDFYPNGGISMPGCDSNSCDHAMGYHYFAESISSGGFTGTECLNYYAAVLRMCFSDKTLKMGGLTPKNGHYGVYYLETNADAPYSKG
ncbi:pancreatic triacylglycerol lipase-like [Melitaea cinxia]|uniref:pancreatic triacylglycerol lipase-like n=1 Tax=Melitaea cinxia TaxID=113334 RepID=UPI001E27220C|nr:pancreatic triacylglycerol lipase-like [Melitaea cinxia]